MAGVLTLKYAKFIDGSYRYRRRVPDWLRVKLGITEFKKVLGQTHNEAIKAYSVYHAWAEAELADKPAKDSPVDPMSQWEIKAAAVKFLRDRGLEVHGVGGRVKSDALEYDPGEIAREAHADQIVNKYHLDDNGRPVGISKFDDGHVKVLLGGAEAYKIDPLISDAFKLYLREKAGKFPDPAKRKQQVTNFARAERNAIDVIGDIPISKITHFDAMRLRDKLAETLAPSSVKRQLTYIKSVIAMAVPKFGLQPVTAFIGLDLPEDPVSEQDKVLPLNADIIAKMYDSLQDNQVLSDIWTLNLQGEAAGTSH